MIIDLLIDRNCNESAGLRYSHVNVPTTVKSTHLVYTSDGTGWEENG